MIKYPVLNLEWPFFLITAERTGGLCMPCKNGIRKNIEQAKEYYKKERQLDRTCPFRALWRELVNRVFQQEGGFGGLTEDEKVYFSVNTLSGEVYNGGFIQYFDNSAAEHYSYTELGLVGLGAVNSLQLLRNARHELFGRGPVPQDQAERWAVITKHCDESDLELLDSEFYKDRDELDKKMQTFAIEVGLIKSA